MKSDARVNRLERKVLEFSLPRIQKSAPDLGIDVSVVTVSRRDYTGRGFFTYLDRSELLHVGSQTESYIWGEVAGKVNTSVITGYLIYIENGYVATIEGFSYGDNEWPQTIEEIELYPYDGVNYP